MQTPQQTPKKKRLTKTLPETPDLKICRQFRLAVIVWRYPIRLFLWLTFIVLFYPDLSQMSFSSLLAISLGGFLLLYAGPVITTYLEYKRIPVFFYSDRIELRESLLIKDNLKMPYRNVIEAKCTANMLQKHYGLQTLCIKLKSGSDHRKTGDYWFKLDDIKRSENIKAICSACGVD